MGCTRCTTQHLRKGRFFSSQCRHVPALDLSMAGPWILAPHASTRIAPHPPYEKLTFLPQNFSYSNKYEKSPLSGLNKGQQLE